MSFYYGRSSVWGCRHFSVSEHSVYQCVINLRSGRERLQGQEGEEQEDKKERVASRNSPALHLISHRRNEIMDICYHDTRTVPRWILGIWTQVLTSAQQAHLQHCIFCVACSSRIHPWKNKVDIMYQNKDLTQYNTVSYNISNCTMKKIFITQEKQNKIWPNFTIPFTIKRTEPFE